MNTAVPCHICSGALSTLPWGTSYRQVTSDCRPWDTALNIGICERCGAVQKPSTEKWLVDMDRLYAGYHIYSQADGEEQKVGFNESGVGVARSERIVDFLLSNGLIKESGKLLDFGCGNGAFLRAFRKEVDSWQLFGLELDDRYRDLIEAIPETKLLTTPITEIQDKFEAVVMVHALEHIPNPVSFLQEVHKILSTDGIILIEVPNFEKSPFDILIADHSTHFTPAVLKNVVESAGFEVMTLAIDYVAKELSLAARKSKSYSQAVKRVDLPTVDGSYAFFEKHADFLESIILAAKSIDSEFGIFGSSISATWLA